MACSDYVLTRLYEEFHSSIEGARIDRVLNIGDKSIAFILYHNGKTKTLMLSLVPTLPLCLVGEDIVPFVEESHGFMDILKKYIEHGQILSFEKIRGDRILKFHVRKRLPTYVYEETTLVFELIPLRANLILLDKENKIIDAFHKSDGFEGARPILKGLTYLFFDNGNRMILEEDTLDSIKSKVSRKEFAYLSSLSDVEFLNAKKKMMTGKEFFVTESDVSLLPLKEAKMFLKEQLLGNFLWQRKKDALKLRYQEIVHFILQRYQALKRKEERIQMDLKKCENSDTFLEYGQLLYYGSETYKKGDKEVNIEGVLIPLRSDKNLQQNAQEYFKRYKKSKIGVEKLKEQLIKTKKDITYFEELKTQCIFADEEDYQDIIKQLQEDCYLKTQKGKKKRKKEEKVFHPHFLTYRNMKIGYGLSSFQNDYLTFTLAHKNHYFLHAKDAHGPHVIVFSEQPENEVLLFAAEIACFYASLDGGDVYVTERKNVKKIPAKTGLVEISNYKEIHLTKIREETKLILNQSSIIK